MISFAASNDAFSVDCGGFSDICAAAVAAGTFSIGTGMFGANPSIVMYAEAGGWISVYMDEWFPSCSSRCPRNRVEKGRERGWLKRRKMSELKMDWTVSIREASDLRIFEDGGRFFFSLFSLTISIKHRTPYTWQMSNSQEEKKKKNLIR